MAKQWLELYHWIGLLINVKWTGIASTGRVFHKLQIRCRVDHIMSHFWLFTSLSPLSLSLSLYHLVTWNIQLHRNIVTITLIISNHRKATPFYTAADGVTGHRKQRWYRQKSKHFISPFEHLNLVIFPTKLQNVYYKHHRNAFETHKQHTIQCEPNESIQVACFRFLSIRPCSVYNATYQFSTWMESGICRFCDL